MRQVKFHDAQVTRIQRPDCRVGERTDTGKVFGWLLVRGVGQESTAVEVHECGDSRVVEVSL